MAERRYSEDEVRAIFDLATQAQAGGSRRLAAGEGMTLAGLQEIGREVGIAPELVAEAASALDRRGRDATRTLLGLPIGVSKTVDLGRELSDKEWERLVVDLRETFDATGKVRVEGALRQWNNGNLKIMVQPTANGHQVRLQTLRSTSLGLISGGLALLGVVGVLAASLAASGRLGEQRPLTGIIFLAAMSMLTFAWGALPLPGWARRRRQQMEELVERLKP